MVSRRAVLGIAVLAVLLMPASAWAWGPATHVKLAGDVLSNLALLPVAVAALLRRFPRDYIFGNIAADVVLAKRLSRVKQFCHHWETGFEILSTARTGGARAFGMGYLSHLAADTVAHNKFIPRQVTLTQTTLSFGHLYWEMRADATIGPYYWGQLRSLLSEAFVEHRMILSSRMNEAFLPFAMNWRLFHRMNEFFSRRSLRWVMDRWHAGSRWALSDQLMREYRAECLDRIIDVLSHQRESAVLHEDPNGNAALAHTKARRRQLRQMARSGLIAPHVMYEAAINHGPINATAVFLPRRTRRNRSRC